MYYALIQEPGPVPALVFGLGISISGLAFLLEQLFRVTESDYCADPLQYCCTAALYDGSSFLIKVNVEKGSTVLRVEASRDEVARIAFATTIGLLEAHAHFVYVAHES